MSAIDEGIVREYFEQNGFLVRQVRKYQVQARRKTGDEEIDLVVYNPAYSARSARKPDFFLFANELAFVHRAIVVVKGWHTGKFTPNMLKSSPEIFRFLEENVLKEHGIDGIISFRSMLLDIIERVEINKSYGKSDTLQVIRILKNYDLLKHAQLDLIAERYSAPRKGPPRP